MNTATVGKYYIEYDENENTRNVNGNTHPLYTITITDNETNTTIEVPDVVRVFEREDWIDTIYTNSKAGLDSHDGPSCCYKDARYIV